MRTMVRSSFFALNESQSGKIGNNIGLVSSDCQALVRGEDFTVSIPGWINCEDLTVLPRVMYCLLHRTRVDIQVVEISDHVEMGTLSAYHLYGNFRKKNSIKWYGFFF